MWVPKFPKLGLSQLCEAITLCADLRLTWVLKQSCNHCQELSNGMSHATCTQGNRGDSWFLVVGSQIVKLTHDPSFGHNFCFRCPNGSCDPIFNIYVPRSLQWYKEVLNPMGFDLCNHSLKIRESIGTPTLKVGVHLRVWRFNSHTLPYSQPARSMKCDSQASLLACTLANPCLGRDPKAKVTTKTYIKGTYKFGDE